MPGLEQSARRRRIAYGFPAPTRDQSARGAGASLRSRRRRVGAIAMRSFPIHRAEATDVLGDATSVDLPLPGHATSIARARRALDFLAGRVAADVLDDLRLLV